MFDRTLERLSSGQPAVLLVVGEPGIGKTRLLSEFVSRADTGGRLVLSGAASELERDVPFGVFVDALDEYLRSLAPAQLAMLDDQTRGQLAQVFPAMAGSAEADVAPTDERYRIHRAVRQLLAQLAANTSVMLVLDDLHWADSGSIELLTAVLQRPPVAPVLVTMAIRPRQVPELLAAALDRAEAAGLLTRVEPSVLSLDDAVSMLDGLCDAETAAGFYAASAGNPLYLEQLARASDRPLDEAPAAAPALGDVELPAPVAAALRGELAMLPADARTVLEGAAVAGDPFEPELAAAAADVSEGAAIDTLDELLQRDLVRPTSVPRRFAFRHPLVRAAVYEAIRPARRIGAHERIADALSARGASAASLAHHVDQSARHGDTGAVAILRDAAETLSYRSPDGAARWLEAALRLLPETAPSDERVELLTSLAKARAATGRLDDAREALLSGVELLGERQGSRAVAMTVTCAGVEQLLGRHEEARRRLERALQRLGDANDPEAAALMIQLALDASYRPSSEGWQHWITRALALIEPLDDAPLRALGFSVAALLCAFATEVAEADEYRSRAVAVVDQLDDEEQATCLEALVHLAGAEVYLEHFEPAIGHGQRALVLSRATGQGGLLPILAPALSLALWTRGQLADAVDVLDGAIESGRLVRDRQALAWHLLNRGFTAATAGDVDVALRACRESFELGQELDGSFIAMWASICLAAAHLENDDPAEALELFDISGAGEVLELVPGFWRAMWLDILSRCQIGAGDVAGARRSAAAAEDVASSTPMLRMAGAWAARAAARVALADGDAQSAAASALRSADIFDDVGAPIEAGLARALAGAALAGTGDRVRAIDELTRAAGAFDGCGAIRYRQSAERELRKLGQHVQRTPRGRGVGDGLASLTDREMEVARLVVERKTNPEIAGELFLSQKTVETHLRNIFHKLEVSSRVEVARAVERARAADPG